MIDLELSFRYLNECCHGNQFCEKNVKLPTFVALAFRNGIGYRDLNDACISCENFVKFGPVTPELTELICERLVRHGQKLAYLVEYLWMSLTDFRNFCTI